MLIIFNKKNSYNFEQTFLETASYTFESEFTDFTEIV